VSEWEPGDVRIARDIVARHGHEHEITITTAILVNTVRHLDTVTEERDLLREESARLRDWIQELTKLAEAREGGGA
jgi:hypothetical protein